MPFSSSTISILLMVIPFQGAACVITDRQVHVEPRSVPHFSFKRQLAALFLDNGPGNPQSKSRVLRAIFRGEERIEHAIPDRGRDAGAVVLNRQADGRWGAAMSVIAFYWQSAIGNRPYLQTS